jgi:hypothetical protein
MEPPFLLVPARARPTARAGSVSSRRCSPNAPFAKLEMLTAKRDALLESIKKERLDG